VVVHLAKRVHQPVEAHASAAQHFQPVVSIVVVHENILAPVATRRDTARPQTPNVAVWPLREFN